MYDGKLLQSAPVREFGAVDSLRLRAWAPLVVACSAGRITAAYNGRTFFDAVRVDEFDIGLASLKYNNNVRRSNRKDVLQQATGLVSISR